MIIIWEKSAIYVTRGTFPRVRGGSWGTAEASFWRHLRDTLNENDDRRRWRRVNPQKHGHMTGSQYMLLDQRNRQCIHDVDMYAVRDPAEDYNRGEQVRLSYLPDYGKVG